MLALYLLLTAALSVLLTLYCIQQPQQLTWNNKTIKYVNKPFKPKTNQLVRQRRMRRRIRVLDTSSSSGYETSTSGGPTENQIPLLSDPDQHLGPLYHLLHIIIGEGKGWMIWTIRKKRFLRLPTPHSGGLLDLQGVQHKQSTWGRIRKRSKCSSGQNLLTPNELSVKFMKKFRFKELLEN